MGLWWTHILTASPVPNSRIREGKICQTSASCRLTCESAGQRAAHFRSIDPGQRTPRELIDRIRQENEEHRPNASRMRLWCSSITVHGLIHDDYDGKASCHQNWREPESRSSIKAFAHKEDVQPAHDKLLCSEKAGDQERLVLVVADEDAEDLRSKVGQGCHSGALLSDEDTETKYEAVPRIMSDFFSYRCIHLARYRFDGSKSSAFLKPAVTLYSSASPVLISSNSALAFGPVVRNKHCVLTSTRSQTILTIIRTDPLQTRPGLLNMILLREPPHAFMTWDEANSQHRRRNQLKSHGDLPLCRACWKACCGAVVDLERLAFSSKEHPAELQQRAHTQ